MIISSLATPEEAQSDGRFWVREVHTWDSGQTQEVYYLCDPKMFGDLADVGVNCQAIADQRAKAINDTPLPVIDKTRVALVQALTDYDTGVPIGDIKAAVDASVAIAVADVALLDGASIAEKL